MMETLLVNGLSKYIFIVRNKNAVDEKAFEKLEAIIYIYIYIYIFKVTYDGIFCENS